MPDRREFLATAAALSASAGSPAAEPAPGLVVREADPPNLETPLAALASPITPTERFFVRCHFPLPAIDRANWSLAVAGAVARPLKLGYDEMLALPRVTKPLTFECAGNSRVFLTPKVRGVNWSQGAVGTAEWSGPTLADVLDRAGVAANAVDVVLEGADRGVHVDEPKSPGTIAYARSLPVAKARRPEVILATHMNGEPLTPEHGWPLRVVVGGWYGMASVKWLTRILVTTTPFNGYWQTMDYSYFERIDGVPSLKPITAMGPKAIILEPAARAELPRGRAVTIRGAAWAGEQAVTAVEWSADGGASWAPARLAGPGRPFLWSHWTAEWTPAAPGPTRLLARATDDAGRSQPPTRDGDLRTYQIRHPVPVPVTVRN